MDEKLKHLVYDFNIGLSKTNPVRDFDQFEFAQTVADFREKQVLEEIEPFIAHHLVEHFVTTEMAKDAGDPSLAGQRYSCFDDCPRCKFDQRLAALDKEAGKKK